MNSNLMRLIKTDVYAVVTDGANVYVYESIDCDSNYNELVGVYESIDKFIEAGLPWEKPTEKVA